MANIIADNNLDKFRYVDLSEMGHGARIGLFTEKKEELLKVNPRGEIGKLGVACHGRITRLFHQTVDVQVKDRNGANQILHLNKRSLTQWMNSQLPTDHQVTELDANDAVVAKLKDMPKQIALAAVKRSRKEAQQALKDGREIKVTHPATLNHRSLGGFFNRVKSTFWGVYYRMRSLSLNTFKLRFGIGLSEKRLAQASKIRAVDARRQAMRVPAYREFLQRNNGNEAVTFDQLPTMTKDNYIKPALEAKKELDLYLDGRLPATNVKRDTSTGTSGKSTPWRRGAKEQAVVEKLSSYAAKVIVGNRPCTVINGFAVGPWATGITVAFATDGDSKANISTIGPNIPEIWEAIKEEIELRPPGHAIVVTGYPPHIRAVVDLAAQEVITFMIIMSSPWSAVRV